MRHSWHNIQRAIFGHFEEKFQYGVRRSRRRPGWRVRYWRVFEQVIIALFCVLVGFWIATAGLNQPPGQYPAEALWAVLYWPVLFGQVIASLSTLAITTTAITRYRHQQTWDTLRTTPSGMAHVLRAEWVEIFYRLRPLLTLLTLVRGFLLALIFYHLATAETINLSYMIQGIVPTVPFALSVLLLVCLMTACILLPLTAIGLDAAIGLWVGVYLPQHAYAIFVQFMLLMGRLLLVGELTYTMTRFLNGHYFTDVGDWLLATVFAAQGDWGLALLNLEFSGLLWTVIPYGIFIGVGLLFLALFQAFLTDRVLALAIRQAQTRE